MSVAEISLMSVLISYLLRTTQYYPNIICLQKKKKKNCLACYISRLELADAPFAAQ